MESGEASMGGAGVGPQGFGHTVTLGPAVVHLPAVWKIQVSKRCSSQVFKLETARPVEMKCVCVGCVCVCACACPAGAAGHGSPNHALSPLTGVRLG